LLAGKITREDVVRVARRMLRSPPAVAAYGTLDRLPSLDDIQQGLASKDGAMPRRFSLFRS
jgi:processing peptidase subunit alpha